MTAYLTREAWEHLMVAVRDDSGTVFQQHQRICAALDSLPVVDAVPAEEALGRLASRERTVAYDDSVQRCDDEAAVRHALRAAQAQADAPPPPDVIRRGHRALDRIVCAGEDGPDAPEWGDQEVADVRAAMHPLPKEE